MRTFWRFSHKIILTSSIQPNDPISLKQTVFPMPMNKQFSSTQQNTVKLIIHSDFLAKISDLIKICNFESLYYVSYFVMIVSNLLNVIMFTVTLFKWISKLTRFKSTHYSNYDDASLPLLMAPQSIKFLSKHRN